MLFFSLLPFCVLMYKKRSFPVVSTALSGRKLATSGEGPFVYSANNHFFATNHHVRMLAYIYIYICKHISIYLYSVRSYIVMARVPVTRNK